MPDLADPRITARLKELRGLPALSATCHKVLELAASQTSGAKDIARVVQADPALTTRVLTLVNSPFYGFPRRITSVANAVAVIGLNALKNLVVSLSVVKVFKDVERVLANSGTQAFQLQRFWEHSLACGCAARALAVRLRIPEPELLFVAGLVHDIGKVVEACFFPQQFPKVVEKLVAGIRFQQAEQEVFGFDHAEIAMSLLEIWRLPEGLVRTVAAHHRPATELKEPKLAAVVHVADVLVNAAAYGESGNRRVPPLDRPAWDLLALPLAEMDAIYDTVERDLAEARKMLQ